MPLHHAVLALLAGGPSHGYELKGSFEQVVGQQWGGLNIGHLYQVLDRLSRDGLIDSERRRQQVKPDRVVHTITEAGRVELERWLAEPATRTRGYRDDFFLKVMATVRLGDDKVLQVLLRQQRSSLLQELRRLDQTRTLTGTSPVVALLVTAAELHTRADLELVDSAEKALTPNALAALRAGPPTASTEDSTDRRSSAS